MTNVITKTQIQQEWNELIFLIILNQTQLSQEKIKNLVDKCVDNSKFLEDGGYHIPYLFELTPSNWKDLNAICYYPVSLNLSDTPSFSFYSRMLSAIKRYKNKKAYSYLCSCIDTVIAHFTQPLQFANIGISYNFQHVTIILPSLINLEYSLENASNVKFTISPTNVTISFLNTHYHFTMSEFRDTQFLYALTSLYWQCVLCKECQRHLKLNIKFNIPIRDQM